MQRTTVLVTLLSGTVAVFAKEEIRTYSVPKSHPFVAPAAPMANADGITANKAPLQWKTPASWQELPAAGMRIGNFVVSGKDGKKAEVTITSFAGDVGGEVANVNRWRNELHLPPHTEGAVSSENVDVDSTAGKLYDFSGSTARTVVASVPREGFTWFFKIRGDKEVVADARATFLEFLKTIRFEAKEETAAAGHPIPVDAPPTKNEVADPHAGISGAPPLNNAAAPAEADSGEPQWNIPSNWKEKPASMMVLKSFTVSDDGKDAAVSISMFGGDVGGVVANINRWRGQLSLPPVSDEEAQKLATPLEVAGGKATLVDMKGTDVKSGKPARLFAVMVPHAGSTWFYKLLGDETVVAKEKDAFLKFVQTVRYP